MLVSSWWQNAHHSLSKHVCIHTSKGENILFLLLRRKCFPWNLQMAYHFCSLAGSGPHGQAQLWGTVRKRLSYFQRLHNEVWRGMISLGITNWTCEVNWALESITMNQANGGDGIPVELFQILKDDAVKVLHSIWQQIWETQQWAQDWKRSVFIPIPKKGNAKERSNYCTIELISHASKVMLKILQARLQQYVNHLLPDVQAGFRKGRGTRDQVGNIH